MWRNRTSCSHIKIDVCLRVPKRSASRRISKSTVHKESKLNHGTKQNERTIFEQYATQKNLTPADWYQLSSTSLDESVRDIISKRFGGSLYRALSTIFPEIEWKPWRFQHQRVPPNFWKEQSNQRKFFDDLGHTLGVKSLDDWYEKLSKKEIIKFGGAVLQPIAALMTAYPEHNWAVWRFPVVPHGFWNDKTNQRKFFDDLGQQLGIKTLDDWYEKLSYDAIIKHGGRGLLNTENESAIHILMAAYPEHKWVPWRFNNVPHGFWNSKDDVKQFLNELSEKLSIQTLDDWYRVRRELLIELGASTLINKYKGLYNLLKEQYPEHPWDPNKFKQAKQPEKKSIADISENQQEWRLTFEQYAKQNNITPTDWYQLSLTALREDVQQLVSDNFGGSLYRALSTLFPEIEWKAWKFQHQQVPKNFWKEQSNQRKFFDDLGHTLGVKTLDDWYEKLSKNVIYKHGGATLVDHQYNDSPTSALMAAYPEHNWIPYKFSKVSETWNELNHRQFFDDLGKQLGIKTLDDWYEQLSDDVIVKNGGAGLLKRFNGSPHDALVAAYPEHNWAPWQFKNVAKYSKQQARQFLAYLTQKLSIQNLDDWHGVTAKQLKQLGASSLIKQYKGLYNLLKEQYPHHPWDSNRSEFKLNPRKAFDELGKRLGVKTLDDWYDKLSFKEIAGHGDYRLIRQKPVSALMAAYPEHDWTPWKFNMVPKGYWNDVSNQRKFFDDLGKHLGIQKMGDWYSKISGAAVVKHGGGGLLQQYKQSPAAALMAAYPEYNWIPWRFATAPHGIWSSKDNVKLFMNELSEKLSIQTLDDWYHVSSKLLVQVGASGLLDRYKKLYNILKEQYPHHPWDPNRFNQSGKKTQRWLAVTLKKIFPNEEILQDYMHPKITFPSSNRPLQLDIYIPSKSLAFEYQGEQHYMDVGIFSPTRNYQQRDEDKRALCAANNIKLIEVPYWWNRTERDLQQIMVSQ